jgi:hypothetical protein
MMNKSSTKKSILIIALIFAFSSAFSSKRTINLAGLIFNAQTLAPIEAANIYDYDGKLLGATDKNGYYQIKISYTRSGELDFKLKVVKEGFHDILQHEHWGNLSNGSKNIMYFGLRDTRSKGESLSSLIDPRMNNNDLSYENVLKGFDKVKSQKSFNDKLANAKAGNENVLIQIDGEFYIVDSTGWIKLNSDKDLVSIDDTKVISADKLNSTIKRKDVTWMTPVDSKEAKFAIHTK